MKFFPDYIIKRRFQIQKIILKIRGAQVGEGNTFNDWIKISGSVKNLKIGNSNVFNEFILLNCKDKITIGDHNHFSAGCKLITTRLSDDLSSHVSNPITIEDNTWLAVDVVIATNKEPISIGSNIIIGAKSLILKSLYVKGKYFGVQK